MAVNLAHVYGVMNLAFLSPNYFEKLEAEADEDKGLFTCSTGGFGWQLSPMAILLGLLSVRRRS